MPAVVDELAGTPCCGMANAAFSTQAKSSSNFNGLYGILYNGPLTAGITAGAEQMCNVNNG